MHHFWRFSQESTAHSLSLKTHYLRCLPVLPLLLYLLLLSLPAASAAAFVQACCWFLTAQQIRFARQCSCELTWVHLIAASNAKKAPLASWVLPPTSSLSATRQPTKRVPCVKGGVVQRLRDQSDQWMRIVVVGERSEDELWDVSREEASNC